MEIFDKEKFNNTIIILDVTYDEKDIAKKYKARWSSDDKYWYIIHNKDGNVNNCFGDINIIKIFKIKEIEHKYYEKYSNEYNELIKYYKDLKEKL